MNRILPRPYQNRATDAVLNFFESGQSKKHPIVIAPTGSGKSLIIAMVTQNLSGGVLVLQPTKETLEQNYTKFVANGGTASICSASMGSRDIGQVTFAMIGSVKKIPHLFDHARYIIIDECHLVPPKEGSMFTEFLNSIAAQSKDVRIVGLTATAFRLKKYTDPFSGARYAQINMLMRERPHFFDSFLDITQIGDLYRDGYLCPIKYLPLAWENGSLKYNSTGAEFDDESVTKEIKRQKILEHIPGLVQQSIEKGRKHRLVFVSSVAAAEYLASTVPDSACVSSATKKKDRERILCDFRDGKIKTVFNVGVLTVGFDFPALDTIIIAQPTLSLTLYMQMIGRGIRLCDGKEDCAVVDMCGNVERFGHIEDIVYRQDENGKWMLHNGRKQLSGVRL